MYLAPHDVTFASKFQCLFEPKRYKVFYGGRGGAKTWSIARALLVKALSAKLLILCVREFQKAIADSVHRVLKDQIDKLGWNHLFDITDTSIICIPTGSEFAFEGIRLNVNKIRSFEGADICWVEEAVNVSANSWKVLIPTIRKSGSEIWMSFNPELEDDETYKRFVLSPPTNSHVVFVNYWDNPWFFRDEDGNPSPLPEEMERSRAGNYPEYQNVWEGHCKQIISGAVYGEEMASLRLEQRVTTVPYDRSKPVDIFWDLGYRDMTALWFVQKVGFQYRVLRYFEHRGKHVDWYVQKIQTFEYTIGTMWLPHDAKAKTLGTKRSVQEQISEKGYKTRITPNLRVADGIDAARRILPECWFDKEKCEQGLLCLRNYKYSVDEKTKRYSEEPEHDEYSHGADAFRYFAVGYKGTDGRGASDDEGLVRRLLDKVNPFGEQVGWAG